jgi:hypothetical protein
MIFMIYVIKMIKMIRIKEYLLERNHPNHNNHTNHSLDRRLKDYESIGDLILQKFLFAIILKLTYFEE